ncbi:hypothetical protein [Xanthobacter sp. KR7-225]|uniref:hypothetical protein n=1 Tax=Xanthobacter sp. KR7-225 TaxID=3156613 RepID=UPI0032B5020B
MRLIALIFSCFLACIALAAMQPAAAHEADEHMLSMCVLHPKLVDCEAKKTAFRNAYVKAFRGDLEAQRVVAYTLWRGSDVVVTGDGIAACKWYMTMIALGSPKLQEMDFANMRTACSLLRPDQVEVARNQARALGHRIIAKDKIDTTVYVYKPDPKLDGTAQPLGTPF